MSSTMLSVQLDDGSFVGVLMFSDEDFARVRDGEPFSVDLAEAQRREGGPMRALAVVHLPAADVTHVIGLMREERSHEAFEYATRGLKPRPGDREWPSFVDLLASVPEN